MAIGDGRREEIAVKRSTTELTWLAHRYVLDELEPAEAEAFEDRLASEDEAATAVAAAVRLIASLKASADLGCVETMTSRRRDVARRGRAWLQTSMAAIATCAVALLLVMEMPERSPRAPLEPAELIGRWNELAMDAAVGSGLVAAAEPPAVERLPRWLVAAVALAGEAVVAEERN